MGERHLHMRAAPAVNLKIVCYMQALAEAVDAEAELWFAPLNGAVAGEHQQGKIRSSSQKTEQPRTYVWKLFEVGVHPVSPSL